MFLVKILEVFAQHYAPHSERAKKTTPLIKLEVVQIPNKMEKFKMANS